MSAQQVTKQTKTSLSLHWSLLLLAILAIPLIAMQITDAVVWGAGDFALAALLPITSGFGCVLIVRQRGRLSVPVLLGVAIVIGVVLAWIEFAVGVI